MKRITTLVRFSIFMLSVALVFPATSKAQINFATETEYFPGEVLVQLKPGHHIDEVLGEMPAYIGLKSEAQLSDVINIWYLKFNPNAISHRDMLGLLYKHSAVNLAQNNHYVEERATVPNDPNFGSQWHHVNTGQSSGTPDADIDSDLAWDITTGGLTSLGDTIVVCIVEGGGANYNHPDLIGNFWRNHQEIPNNGIDDDLNGYVDDYDGWRVDQSNDNHGTGGHGTNCMGMTGAVGNDGLGTAGANWKVKMMLVSGFSTSESSVIAAYNYPLKMRRFYNQTNGTKGAFVVATSASWGIDQANPANYPLWCAFYDSLGVEGVLNVGATTNSNFNVDQVGDMPTACASPYMISVTRTGNTDNQAGGYGLTTIDLGAPGINVYTTSGTNGYTTTTGTSFSCPLTAGVIGLLYSVPCTSLITLAKSNPQAAADQVRLALLDGVDPVSSLTTKTVTGGRLNAYNSVMELVNGCGTGSCVAPFSLGSFSVTDQDGYITWQDANSSTDYRLRIRLQGATNWDSTMVTNDTIYVDTLSACTTYEFQVLTDCGSGDFSTYSPVQTFTTDGCCIAPTGFAGNVVSATAISLTWNSVLAATSYDVDYSDDGGSTWTTVNNATSPLNLNSLTACTEYTFRIRTVCSGGPTAYTTPFTLRTSGCGACEDNSYCASVGSSVQDEFIQQVQFNTINNTSGANGGYGDFTGISTTVVQGGVYPIVLTPGYTGQTYSEYFKVWIDYNQDGTFADPAELAYSSNGTVTAATGGNVTIPASATLGTTRMRVSMKYVSSFDSGQPTPCLNGTSFAYGEVEDYCVTIDAATSVVENAKGNLTVFPNPANDRITIEMGGLDIYGAKIEMVNAVGQVMNTTPAGANRVFMDLADLPSGIYFVRIVKGDQVVKATRLVISK